MPVSKTAPVASQSQAGFLRALFQALDQHEVRYCVLHSWESLPNVLTTDLDIGVHPRDRSKLEAILGDLEQQGYVAVQALNYFVNAYFLVFAWSEQDCPRFAALDLIFEHRRGGLIVPGGEAMVANRRRENIFWVPDAAIEFAYLLSKKTWKRAISWGQAKRLQALLIVLGKTQAEHIAEQLFVTAVARKVIAAIEDGSIIQLIPRLCWQTWRTSLQRQPLKALRYATEDAWRRLRRWLHPTGVFVVIAGPDGVGKSSIVSRLGEAALAPFRRRESFHWYPALISRARKAFPVAPHQQPPRGAAWSVAVLLVRFAECWLGYFLRIRWMLARSTLILGDRYFYDVQIDPLRFRFGGPMWVARVLARMAPRPDLVFVLDAPEHVILSRKQELSAQDIEHQRACFLALARQLGNAAAISTETSLDAATNIICSFIVRFLAERFRQCASAVLQTPRHRG